MNDTMRVSSNPPRNLHKNESWRLPAKRLLSGKKILWGLNKMIRFIQEATEALDRKGLFEINFRTCGTNSPISTNICAVMQAKGIDFVAFQIDDQSFAKGLNIKALKYVIRWLTNYGAPEIETTINFKYGPYKFPTIHPMFITERCEATICQETTITSGYRGQKKSDPNKVLIRLEFWNEVGSSRWTKKTSSNRRPK